MSTQDRGFASMDRDKQREIASKGGRVAHQKGTAHEWTAVEAREAGRKGGLASHRKALHKTPSLSASPAAVDEATESQNDATGIESSNDRSSDW